MYVALENATDSAALRATRLRDVWNFLHVISLHFSINMDIVSSLNCSWRKSSCFRFPSLKKYEKEKMGYAGLVDEIKTRR
jgi:hypothetical protein